MIPLLLVPAMGGSTSDSAAVISTCFFAAGINTLLQTIADDDQRSRVLGLYAMTFLGLGPFGNFIAGALADRIGAHETLLGCGVIIVLSTLVFASGRKSWIKAVRPALQRNGTIA